MTFEISWFVENRIIFAKASGKMTVEELRVASDKVVKMLEASDASLVHILSDESDLESFPISVKALNEVVGFMRHPKMGWMLLYPSDNNISKSLSNILAGVTKMWIRRFASQQEALEFLVLVDSTLPTVDEMQQAGQG